MADILGFLKQAVPVAAPLAGAYLGHRAAQQSADAQVSAGQNALQGYAPYREVGDYAAGEMRSRLTPDAFLGRFSLEDFETSPGYQFRLSEGEKAIDRMMGARGKRYSGATAKELLRFNQGLASDEYASAYDRYMNDMAQQYNMLAGNMHLGYGATGGAGNVLMDVGAVRGAQPVASNQAITQGIGDAIRNWQINQLIGRR